MKVSIIIPFYNTGERLKKCLDSLVKQTLKEIEIICVNDGSTDNSLEIAKQYAEKYGNIKILSQKNSGRSSARNAGLSSVKSPFVMFCDSDDVYDADMCKKMFESITNNQVDVTICGIKTVYLAHQEMESSDSAYYRVNFSGRHYIDDYIIRQTDASVCNKIFKMALINKHHITFPDKLNNEDYFFYNAYMSVAETAYFLPQKLYNYIRHDDGSIMSEMFDKNIYSPDHLIVAKKLFAFYKKNNVLHKYVDLFWHQFAESFWFSYNHSSKRTRQKIQKMGNQFINDHYQNYLPISKKSQREVINIKHNNIIHKIVKRTKNVLAKLYKTVNIAYKQQDIINKKLEQLEQQTYELLDLLNKDNN